jgi:catechol-2,3-dioxygenase
MAFWLSRGRGTRNGQCGPLTKGAGARLSDYAAHAVLAASDIDRARAWYAERLGLEPIREREGQLLYRIGPSILTVYRTSSAGTAKNTVAEWHVNDLHA